MSNLSRQFEGQREAWEDMQRRRYARKKGVQGFIGNGYWFWNYPNMVGTIGAGEITQTQTGDTAGSYDGMGEGGTATSVGGME